MTSSAQEYELDLTFPAPLVLPDDDLALDPEQPPQSLRSWLRMKERNAVTKDRQTIYVAGATSVTSGLSVMRAWTEPGSAVRSGAGQSQTSRANKPKPPQAAHICDYLEAFYHGLAVKKFTAGFQFVKWESRAAKGAPEFIGLRSGDISTRIRTRTCPDGAFARQLNLNDILDAAIEALPKDAYAFLLLVDHDLYGDDDDDFCCGMAYGGSRVAVVSSARYHPDLDQEADIDHEHMWPASHCSAYMNAICAGTTTMSKVSHPSGPAKNQSIPLSEAVEAARAKSDIPLDPYGLWLSRLLRTASHELGHCLALDHCVYYACVMQGTARITEDVRQPPYLCPVCIEKVSRAVLNVNPGLDEQQYLVDRYTAISKFCQKWPGVGMLAGYHAWLGTRLRQLQTV